MKKQLIAAALILCSTHAFAEKDVDTADSLDFQKFHSNKGESVKVYDSKTGVISIGGANAQIGGSSSPQAATLPKNATGNDQTLKQRYTLGNSANTTDTPSTAADALTRKMASQCPKGFAKLAEWSEPSADGDYFLNYSFRCLQ